MRWKFLWRNERTLYKRMCDLCKRSVVTMHHPRMQFPVYCYECWFSDKWDPFSYSRSYDISRPFFEQLGELIQQVPKQAMYSSPESGPNINSEYTNFAGGNKDCYLIFNSGPKNENCAYARGLMQCRDVFDMYYGSDVERSYEGVNIQKSTGVGYGKDVLECLDSWFLLNCTGCQYCFGCVNLRHKSYYFFNEPLSKDEWMRRVSEVLGSYKKMEAARKQFEDFGLKFPRREHSNMKSINCIGDYIFESKNCYACFEVSFAEDLRYVFATKRTKDSFDLVGHGRESELLLEGVGVGWSSRVIGSWRVERSHDIEYCLGTRTSEHCIGCDGLKNAKYCILNKQYSEAEYKKLRTHIVNELKNKELYGLFLPPEISLFAYNETIGQDNLPLSREEAARYGFRWEDDIPRTKDQETMQPQQIPDHIKDTLDSMLNEVLRCVSCGYNYRLIKPELEFYRKLLIPIPRQCFNCRFLDRIKRRGPMKLYERQCGKCKKSIKTTYASDRPEIVYCEQCYNAEVI
ncbi:hypothetical protein HY967_04565 [Candidatus Jorgensenbacteria bacterium]|nr:hypothetical protein [Candidatus Jorgensenbacteria bacterium]